MQSRARRMWKALEPFHAITYFAPETRQATDALGLKGGWMSYFGCRAAPLGAATPELVTAVFYNFHPSMVARALPDAWSYATPAQLLDVRLAAVDNAVRRLFPDGSFDQGWRALGDDLTTELHDLVQPSGRRPSCARP